MSGNFPGTPQATPGPGGWGQRDSVTGSPPSGSSFANTLIFSSNKEGVRGCHLDCCCCAVLTERISDAQIHHGRQEASLSPRPHPVYLVGLPSHPTSREPFDSPSSTLPPPGGGGPSQAQSRAGSTHLGPREGAAPRTSLGPHCCGSTYPDLWEWGAGGTSEQRASFCPLPSPPPGPRRGFLGHCCSPPWSAPTRSPAHPLLTTLHPSAHCSASHFCPVW